jgi:pyridoxal 5'-phosphate synthase pdxS subunit
MLPEIIAEVSEDLGEAMVGIEISKIAPENVLAARGW